MSDFILKFWPKDEVKEIKTEIIKRALLASKVLGEETMYGNKPAFKAGECLNEYLEPRMDNSHPYFKTISIVVADNDYGVGEDEEDFAFFERHNVLSILDGDGTIERWNKMCQQLKDITGDEYDGGWELL